jgi:plastocyanin
MSLYRQMRSFIATILILSSLVLAGQAGAEDLAINPIDITFQGASPYYEPPTAVIRTGIPIRWINQTGSHHSVRHDGCVTEGACAFQSIAVPPDSSFAIAPLAPGRYAYHCELHPIMRGTLVVVEATAQRDRAAPQRDEGR